MIVKDAFRFFLFRLLIITLGAFVVGMPVAGILLLLLSAFVAFFFRNPKRVDPGGSEGDRFAGGRARRKDRARRQCNEAEHFSFDL